MSATKEQLQDWLNSLPEDADIAIDDGGLTLVSGSAYFEIGGIPDPQIDLFTDSPEDQPNA